MNSTPDRQPISIPNSLQAQLRAFQKHVHAIKMLEAIGIAVVAVLFGFLAVFVVDRLVEVGSWYRWLCFLVATLGVATVPIWFDRWVVKHRTPSSLARLMSRKMPAFGDSLLGAIELASNTKEQSRSPALCQAALEQVAADAKTRDLRGSAPDAYHRRWWSLGAIALCSAAVLALLYPSASWNAWQRFTMPWSSMDRYTFAQLERLPNPWIVPHGEPTEFRVPLASASPWQPESATLMLGSLPSERTDLRDNAYRFELPPVIQPTPVRLRVGDATPQVMLEPVLRPQLTHLQAEIDLPEYLQRDAKDVRDARSGTLSVVAGSTVALRGTVNRELAEATADGETLAVQGQEFAWKGVEPKETEMHELKWRDQFGLQAKIPFPLQIQVHPDEPPVVFADGLPRNRVVLDQEQLRFQIRASDDYGIRRVGMEWRTAEGASSTNPVHDEWILTSGSPTTETLDAEAVFQANALKIPPQPIELRIFAEDYHPTRGRTYTAPVLLIVLNAEDHAMWVLQQMNRWQREAMEVRDRELQLLEANRKLRELTPEQLATDEVRTQIEQQASAEQANARRLSGLNQKGEDLLRQAARNPEIGVGHLEKWAEMQKILKDISANRMPSVANLLKQASKSAKASLTQGMQPKVAGTNRNDANGQSEQKQEDNANTKPPAPRVSDQESSQQPIDPQASESESKKKSGQGALRLPTTTVNGTGKSNSKQPDPPPAQDSVNQAIDEQLALLAEFDKVADELNKVMANLEGSTLVKRFKAAAREQLSVADNATGSLSNTFGQRSKRIRSEDRSALEVLSSRETNAVNNVGQIIDDLEAFHDRRPMVKFRDVLKDIEREDPLTGLRQLSQQVLEQQGMAIAEAEYWSDAFDRWAEDLVDPACQGKCPGGKSKASLPPSIVLEVMQILEGEMNLRDRTRVVEQSKEAAEADKYFAAADELAATQTQLRDRVDAVQIKIAELPEAEEQFAKELQLLAQVEIVMTDAVGILKRPETGRPAIGAETEAIELLLQTKRVNPKSGGGGGSSPGGGGGGDTSDAAISLIGPGINDKEVRQDHGVEQSNGTEESDLPEEFRHGLDQYFDRVERRKSQ